MRGCLTAVAASSCLALCAQTPDSIPEGIHQLEEFTLTSRKAPVKADAATPVQSLSAGEMARLGIRDMADAMRRFAGTNVRDYGGIGGLKTVSVRNMGAAHTAVSYDGVAVSNCQAGQVDIGRFSLDNVETLSLAVGQNEDLLQSARLYTSAAVVGISTMRPEFLPGKNSAFRIRMKGGSFGFVNPSLRWWQRFSRTVATSLETDYMHADGNYPYTLVNGRNVTKERRANSDIDSWHAEANIFCNLYDGSEIRAKGYWYWSERGLPGAVILYNPVSTERLRDDNAFLQLRYRKRFNTRWALQAQGKFNHAFNRDSEEGPQFNGGKYQAEHRQREYYLSATAQFTPLPGLDLSLAQDGIVNTLTSTMVGCPDPTRYTSLTALNARWRHSAITINALLAATFITENVKSGSRPADVKRLSPSLSVSFRPIPSEMFFIRAMYKNTFRMPSFNDLYYDRLGSRNLRPEKADEFNLGLTWTKTFPAWLQYVAATADAYYNDVTDKLVAFPTTYAWKMSNFGKVRAFGADITLAASFALPAGINLTLSGAYTWQKAQDVADPDSKTYKAQLPYTPEHSGNAAATIETPWITLGYSAVMVGTRYYLSENIPINEIDSYADHTLSLSHSFDFGKCRLSLRGEIVNLTDCHYDVIKFYPMPGRSWRLTGTFEF